jgi:hypothetical protein
VETTEGWQPHASGGERILVALAAIALVGAILIVAGNLLHKEDAVSLASGSPLPTSSPSPTPVPSPTVMELVVGESTAPSASLAPALFGGWIRTSVDLPILESPSEVAAVVGTLPAGSLAYADEQVEGIPAGGWMTIEAPDPIGWVATRPAGKNLVERLPPAIVPYSGAFQTLAAGPSGFVAIATPSGASNNGSPASLFASPDGITWHASSWQTGPDVYPTGVAWGPKGWLMVGTGQNSDRLVVWRSPDGDRWTVLGALSGGGYPQGLAATGAGYLLTIEGGNGFGNSPQLWFSADGMRWTRSSPGLPGYYQVTATTLGFYATNADCCGPQYANKAAFSTDGLTWSANLPRLFIATVDGALLGIQPDSSGRGAHALHGSFYHGQVRWRPMQDGDAPFSGAVVTSIASDGLRATAFGWDPDTGASFTWTSDGGPWTRHALPSSFGGPPSAATAANGRAVVVGNRWNVRGTNPVVWHQNADGGWDPEPSPVLGFAADPSGVDCGPPPRNALDLINMDRASAVACHGDAPFTIRAWSSSCNGCYGTPDGTYTEPWLASPSTNVLFLSPVKWHDQWSTNAFLPPFLGAAPDPRWVNQWLELTGHFDDPASTRCRWNPPPAQLQYYNGSRPLIETCREQFVVTSVRVVTGP